MISEVFNRYSQRLYREQGRSSITQDTKLLTIFIKNHETIVKKFPNIINDIKHCLSDNESLLTLSMIANRSLSGKCNCPSTPRELSTNNATSDTIFSND